MAVPPKVVSSFFGGPDTPLLSAPLLHGVAPWGTRPGRCRSRQRAQGCLGWSQPGRSEGDLAVPRPGQPAGCSETKSICRLPEGSARARARGGQAGAAAWALVAADHSEAGLVPSRLGGPPCDPEALTPVPPPQGRRCRPQQAPPLEWRPGLGRQVDGRTLDPEEEGEGGWPG